MIKNIFNNKIYVGQTWAPVLERFKKHKNSKTGCVKLINAFSKYGKDNFSIEIILVCHSQVVADYWETYFISKYDSVNNGYNLQSGGSKGKQSQETKDKISESNKLVQRGLKKSPRTNEHIVNQNKARMKNSGLNENTIRNIRKDYATGSFTMRALAAKYSMSKTNIRDIIIYKIWKDIR